MIKCNLKLVSSILFFRQTWICYPGVNTGNSFSKRQRKCIWKVTKIQTRKSVFTFSNSHTEARVSRHFPPWSTIPGIVAPHEISPRTITPPPPQDFCLPENYPYIISPLDNCPPDNCPLWNLPRDSYPWIIPPRTTTPEQLPLNSSPLDNNHPLWKLHSMEFPPDIFLWIISPLIYFTLFPSVFVVDSEH